MAHPTMNALSEPEKEPEREHVGVIIDYNYYRLAIRGVGRPKMEVRELLDGIRRAVSEIVQILPDNLVLDVSAFDGEPSDVFRQKKASRQGEHDRLRAAGVRVCTFPVRQGTSSCTNCGFRKREVVQKQVDMGIGLAVLEAAGCVLQCPSHASALFLLASDSDFLPVLERVHNLKPKFPMFVCSRRGTASPLYMTRLRSMQIHLLPLLAVVPVALMDFARIRFGEGEGVQTVLQAIENQGTLGQRDGLQLHLEYTRLNSDQLQLIDKALQNETGQALELTELWCHHCRLDDNACCVIAGMIARYPMLKQLHLSHNVRISVHGIVRLLHAATREKCGSGGRECVYIHTGPQPFKEAILEAVNEWNSSHLEEDEPIVFRFYPHSEPAHARAVVKVSEAGYGIRPEKGKARTPQPRKAKSHRPRKPRTVPRSRAKPQRGKHDKNSVVSMTHMLQEITLDGATSGKVDQDAV